MNELFANLEDVYYDFQPLLLPFLKFILVIVVGTIFVLIVARLIKKLLHGVKADEWLASLLPQGDGSEAIKVEEPASKLTVFVGMLIVAVSAFKNLPGNIVSDSLNRAFTIITDYAPRIGSALLLLLIAALLAKVLKLVIQKSLEISTLDQRLKESVGFSVAKPLSEISYWSVIIIFLPQILDSLRLERLVEPIQLMLSKFFGYVPNLVVSGLILFVGLYVVRFLRSVATNSVIAFGADTLGKRLGLNKAFGENFLSRAVGWMVYGLGMIAVFVTSLNSLQLGGITDPLVNMLRDLLSFIPMLLAGVVILGLTYVMAKFLSEQTKGWLENSGFDSMMDRTGLWKTPQDQDKGQEERDSASSLAGKLAFLAILILGSLQILEVFHFSGLAALLSSFVGFAGKVLLGLVILAVGFFIADWAERLVKGSNTNQKEFLGTLTKVSVWVLAGIMALDQMEMANTTINIAFGIILGGLALASALAFGMGGQSLAKELLIKWDAELNKSPAAKPRKTNTKKRRKK